MLVPDSKTGDGLNLYDSTVDDINDPSIFVCYHDAQAYPDCELQIYLVSASRGHQINGPRCCCCHRPGSFQAVTSERKLKSVREAMKRRRIHEVTACALSPQGIGKKVGSSVLYSVSSSALYTTSTICGGGGDLS